jgi:hypothetical protein
MRKSLIAVSLSLTAFASAASVAGATESTQTATVTATVTTGNIGLRSIGLTPAIALTAIPGQAYVSGGTSAQVVEAAVTGANPWTLTAALTDLGGTAGQPNASDTIPKANVSVSGQATTAVGGGGTKTDGASGDMSAARTLVSYAQSVTSVFTGTYTNTATLTATIPNGNHLGAYTGTLTYTLIQ